MTEELLPPWDAYSRLQKHSRNTSTINSVSWGLEREMDLFLENPTSYASLKSAATLKKANASAARRARAQAQMRKKYAGDLAPQPANPEQQLEARAKILLIQKSVAPASWEVLLKVGQGHTLNELAIAAGKRPGTMRVVVSRLRAQVTHLCAA